MSSHRGSYPEFNRGTGIRSWHDVAPQSPPPPKPWGPSIDSINNETLLIEDVAPTIEDAEYVASYNWVGGKSPVILVPGSPAAWTPPATDSKLSPDSEDVFRDINAARYASYPLEPMIRSLKIMQPHYDLRAVDIVGCGNTIGNLLRFAGCGNTIGNLLRSSGPEQKPFRFDVDLIGNTLFLVRKESSPTELIADLQGYGHTFPEAYTTWDSEVRGSCSHQRIVQYEFGGLKFLVRTGTKGYVKDANTLLSVAKSTSQPSLKGSLGAMAMSSTEVAQDQQLRLKRQGTRVHQDQIFDIKTRASNKIFDMDEFLPRLWVSQTSKFLIARHQFGLFDRPEVKDVRQEVLRWEKNNSALLARFHAIVKRLVDVVSSSDKQQCEVSWDGDGKGPLCVTKQIGEGRRALPSDLVRLLEADVI